MAYNLVKGWPSAGAIDESFTPVTETATYAETLKGMVVDLDTDGKVSLATYTGGSADSGIAFFCYDFGTIRPQALCIKSPVVIECDSDHYVAGSFTVGAKVTATAGKFAVVSGDEEVVGRVISYDATSGTLRVLWTSLS